LTSHVQHERVSVTLGTAVWLIIGQQEGPRVGFCLFCFAAVSTANANSSLNVLLFLGI